MSLLLPIALAGSTVASIVTPYFLPKTEAQKVEEELNKKLSNGNFSINTNQNPIKVPSFTDKLKNQIDDVKVRIDKNPSLGYGLIALVIIIILMVMR